MALKGFSHVGLSTLDLDRTTAFYEGVLGFKAVRRDTLEVKEGGAIRHAFFDLGLGHLIAFMEARGVPGIPGEYDAGINRGLGVPDAFYHFAFDVGSQEALEKKRAELIEKGVHVTPVVDHEWAKSIYFKDPNNLTLEYCYQTRPLTEDDARMQVRATISVRDFGL
jgi:catechol 2,3-dioxygenase-like lactoylglutathione lyase family enzyme